MNDRSKQPLAVSGIHPRFGLAFGSLLRADFTVLIRNGRTLILNVAVPIFILVLIGLRLGKGGNALTNIGVGFVIGLALTYGLMASSLMGYSITVARDRDAGVFQRLRVTPTPTWAIMGSRILVQIVVDLIMTVVVLIIGNIMFHTALGAGQYLLIIGVSILGGAMFLAIAQAVVGLIRSAVVVNAVGRILYVVFLLLGLLGSTGLLGTAVQAVSAWTPVGAMIDLYRGVIDIAHWNWADTNGLIAAVGYIVVGAFIGVRWFRWESR
jgi:ABC-2 type transport system permease protein